MRFSIDRTDFTKALQRIQGIVEKRTTMPILSNVLLEAADNRIHTTATDLEVFIKNSTKAKVTDNGSITVNARKLFEIVKDLPSEAVEINATKEGKVTIKGGLARFNIMGMTSKDYPVFPKIDEVGLSPVKKETLKDMIEKTSFAVSTDETRYNINGFLLEKDGHVVRMVTTDGHRLAMIEKTEDIRLSSDDKNSVLLPRKGVMEMKRLLDESDGDYQLGITQKSAVMKSADTVINIRLLEGEFPDYRKVIPKDNTITALIGKENLLASLKRVSILSIDKVKGVKFNFAKAKLTLSSSAPDIGDATEELGMDYSGEDIEIAFNARYLIEMLDATSGDKVEIILKDSLSPAISRPAGANDYTYIIMPMRL